MTNTKEIIAKLSEPFAADEIEWRAGSTNQDKTRALALAYINARAVMNRLDEILGAENWSDSYQVITGEGKRGYICTLALRLNNEWITKADGADESDFEATKGGLSDAFKRAANKWGVGRYLYNLEAIWAPCEPVGKSVKITKVPVLPAWALPQKNAALQEFEKLQSAKASKPTPTPANPNLGAADKTADEKPKPFTLEDACAVLSDDGVPYGKLSVNLLAIQWNDQAKKLKDKGLSPAEKNEAELKLKAAKMVMDARKSGEL